MALINCAPNPQGIIFITKVCITIVTCKDIGLTLLLDDQEVTMYELPAEYTSIERQP